MEELLDQTRLVLAPAVAQFTPVTLPYGYQPTQSGDDSETKKYAESAARILDDSKAFLAALDSKHKSRIEQYEAWKAKKIENEKAERRRIAPGYLDGPNRILVPERTGSEKPVQAEPAQAEPAQAEPAQVEKPAETEKSTESEPTRETIDALRGLQL